MNGERGMLGLRLSVAGYAALFALKLVAWWLTGVFALLAESLHTLSDLVISGFLLAATHVSRRPADATYRYGYGRVQHVAALIAATVFISVTALRLVEEAVIRIVSGRAVVYERLTFAVAVLLFSMIVSAAPLLLLRRQRAPAARAQFFELVNDEAGLVAALAGTLFIAAGYPIADPIASLVVGGFIIVNAAVLVRDNARVLIGRAPSPDFFAQVKAVALGVPPVKAVHDLRAQYVGPEALHLSLHVEVDPDMTIAEGEEVATRVRDAILAATPVEYCVVHVDPLGAPPEPGEYTF
jgi:cation diffusion facilitator family transporter